MNMTALVSFMQRLPAFEAAALSGDPIRLEGGFDTATWAFNLTCKDGREKSQLVLRQFPDAADADRAHREAVVQNALAEVGFPVPVVLAFSTDPGILGTPFLVMTRAPGLVLLELDEPQSSLLMGETHARLHELPVAPIRDALSAEDLDQVYRKDLLDRISIAASGNVWVQRHARWLVENAPPEHTRRLCHGDFHKLNLLQQDGRLTAVLDWSGFSIMDPAIDVANTEISFGIVARHLVAAGDFAEADLDQVIRDYRDGYANVRSLDETNLDYYFVLRATMMLIMVAMGFGAPFRSDAIVADLCDLVSRRTDLYLEPGQVPRQ